MFIKFLDHIFSLFSLLKLKLRWVIKFTSIGSKQEKITEEFRQLNISVNKVINRSEKIMNLDLDEVEKIEKKKKFNTNQKSII